MADALRVALAGLGTVGGGVVRLLDANRDLIARRAGRPIEIVAVSARDRHRDRGVDLARFAWVDDTAALAEHPGTDVVVELIGGADGPALALARRAIAAGRGLVTANKAMLAHHGLELAQAAEAAGTALAFEAAVAGGIPIIKGLRDGAAANAIERVHGILNGTCNFILSAMEKPREEGGGRDFADVLAEAQALGYAEADPSFDIDGIDAAHKLAILASVAFGTRPAFADVSVEGIRAVIAADIVEAAALGYRVRLVGVAEIGPKTGGGGLFQRVHPHLVPVGHSLAHVTGSLNAVMAEGNFVGPLFFQGRGAGEGPTASAVVADLIDIARGGSGPAFAMAAGSLAEAAKADDGERRGRAYLRFTVEDRVGVLAEIAAAMRDAGVSIASLIQRGSDAGGAVLVAIVTHEGPERCVTAALERLRGSQSLVGQPLWMPILG